MTIIEFPLERRRDVHRCDACGKVAGERYSWRELLLCGGCDAAMQAGGAAAMGVVRAATERAAAWSPRRRGLRA